MNARLISQTLFAVSVIVFGGTLFFSAHTLQSQLPTFFGGNIVFVQECSCTGGVAITVGPPVGGTFLVQPGLTFIYPHGQYFRTGPWVLGSWTPGGVCTAGTKLCAPIPVQGTARLIGTSL